MTDTPQWHRYVRADLSDRPSDPRRVPLSSDALFWLAPPRARFKQAAIDLLAVAAACIFVMTTAVAITGALFILLFTKT